MQNKEHSTHEKLHDTPNPINEQEISQLVLLSQSLPFWFLATYYENLVSFFLVRSPFCWWLRSFGENLDYAFCAIFQYLWRTQHTKKRKVIMIIQKK